MNPELTSILIKSGIGLLVGVYVTLLGSRLVGHKPGKSLTYDAWFARNGWWFRVGGPIIIVGNLAFAMYELSK
jgi:hypothetical protein